VISARQKNINPKKCRWQVSLRLYLLLIVVENWRITNNFEFENASELKSFKNNKFWETLKVYMWRKMNLKVISSTFQFVCFILHSV